MLICGLWRELGLLSLELRACSTCFDCACDCGAAVLQFAQHIRVTIKSVLFVPQTAPHRPSLYLVSRSCPCLCLEHVFSSNLTIPYIIQRRQYTPYIQLANPNPHPRPSPSLNSMPPALSHSPSPPQLAKPNLPRHAVPHARTKHATFTPEPDPDTVDT